MNKEQKYIIRTDRAGVFYANIKESEGQTYTLTDARRIHYWRQATECIGISLHGVGKDSRITEAVPLIKVYGVIEEIPVSDEARKSLDAHPAWKA